MKKHADALDVTVASEIGPTAAEAEYVASDYSFKYRPRNEMELRAARSRTGHWRQTGQNIFVTAGFLTLRFEGAPLVLTSIDGYTNRDKWHHVALDIPSPDARGALLLSDRPEDDRMSLPEQPIYEIDEAQRALRIRLTNEGTPRYFAEIGTGLIAGLHEGRLLQLIVLNVQNR